MVQPVYTHLMVHLPFVAQFIAMNKEDQPSNVAVSHAVQTNSLLTLFLLPLLFLSGTFRSLLETSYVFASQAGHHTTQFYISYSTHVWKEVERIERLYIF